MVWVGLGEGGAILCFLAYYEHFSSCDLTRVRSVCKLVFAGLNQIICGICNLPILSLCIFRLFSHRIL